VGWLNAMPVGEASSDLMDFRFLEHEIRPADVLLFAGQTRVSRVIQTVVLSPWTHVGLYIGCLNDIRDPATRACLAVHYQGAADEPLLVESLLGKGTIATPLREYRCEHLRICRPSRLTGEDTDKVVSFAVEHLGKGYDVRQLLDLARFLFPYGLLPRRWRSSLFQHNAGEPTHIVCSSMVARCFQQVHYPILPVVRNGQDNQVQFFQRNFRLFTPSDFDYSPYFAVIKSPVWEDETDDGAAYHHLPWKAGSGS
jgi:hypothetical protein